MVIHLYSLGLLANTSGTGNQYRKQDWHSGCIYHKRLWMNFRVIDRPLMYKYITNDIQIPLQNLKFKSLPSPGQYTIFPAENPKIRILTDRDRESYFPQLIVGKSKWDSGKSKNKKCVSNCFFLFTEKQFATRKRKNSELNTVGLHILRLWSIVEDKIPVTWLPLMLTTLLFMLDSEIVIRHEPCWKIIEMMWKSDCENVI